MKSDNGIRGFWGRYCKHGYRFICFLLCFKEMFKAWESLLIPQPGERVLDGGTGSGGMFLPIMKKVQPSVISAVDFSDEMLEEAQKTAKRLLARDKSLIYRIINSIRIVNLIRIVIGRPAVHLNNVAFEFKNVDLRERFPWADNYFGVVTFNLVVCYMLSKEREHVFEEAHRTLKPGGYLYVSTCLEGWDFSKEVRKRMLKESLLNTITFFRALPVVPCTKEMDRFKKGEVFSFPKEGELARVLKRTKKIGFTDICVTKSFGGGIEMIRAQKPLS